MLLKSYSVLKICIQLIQVKFSREILGVPIDIFQVWIWNNLNHYGYGENCLGSTSKILFDLIGLL